MKQGQHCPYLGLKHNRAIRFASPTMEHRCYVSGEPQEIPVDQARYCLSANHIRCPLYTGEMLASMVPVTKRQGGLAGWVNNLSPRDRAIYGALVGLLGVILIIYAVGAYLLWTKDSGEGLVAPVEATPTTGQVALETEAATATAVTTATREPPTETPATPSATAQPTLATRSPTIATYVIIILSPTPVTPSPTPLPSSTPTLEVSPTPTVLQLPTATDTAEPTQETPEPGGTSEPATQAPSPTSQPATVTSQPTATEAATAEPSTTPAPTEPPGMSVNSVTLYFGDSSGSLLVPVTRSVASTNQWRTTALRELLEGPAGSLRRLVTPGTELIWLDIEDALATVNLTQDPGSVEARQSIVLTLTERTDVTRVQILVDGEPLSSQPFPRPHVNAYNPENLPADYSSTEFLPLYFPLRNTPYHVRVTRFVPKTPRVATETIKNMIEGPGQYASLLGHPIPEGTIIQDIRLDGGTLSVDFSRVFARANDRQDAVSTLLLAITTFPSVQQVVITVDGQPLGEVWGSQYSGPLSRPALNPENS